MTASHTSTAQLYAAESPINHLYPCPPANNIAKSFGQITLTYNSLTSVDQKNVETGWSHKNDLLFDHRQI